MEAYSSHSSAASSTYLPQYQQEAKGLKVTQSFQESLHSVRKSSVKPWKKPIAPFPPTPPKLYKVDPINFRDLVQKLTGAPPQVHPQRLQSVAPPPLNIAKPSMFQRDVATPLQLIPSPVKTPWSALCQELMSETLETNPQKTSDYLIPSTSLGLNLSPSSHSWCSYPLLSPGTLSKLETNPQKTSDYLIPSTSLGLNLSPSSHSWCSYPLLSPGTLSTLEQSTVL